MELFSSNHEKRWVEKFYIKYSLVWPILFYLWCNYGMFRELSDLGNTLVTILIASPFIVVPYRKFSNKLLTTTYWFKYSIWIGIFSFVATYFFTEVFFDVLGMIYNFPNLSWNLDSILLGFHYQGMRPKVPIMMYIHGWYFFVTYHTLAVIFIRAVTSTLGKQIWPLAVIFSAWIFSYGEVYLTTFSAIEDVFKYSDMNYALSTGAQVYSCYFLSSFSMIYWLDESPKNIWSINYVIQNSLAASMISFILLDLYAQFVATEWQIKFKDG